MIHPGAIDGWTAVHLASGIALGRLGVREPAAVAALIGFEIFEAYARRIRLGGAFGEPESTENIFIDILAGMAGYYFSR